MLKIYTDLPLEKIEEFSKFKGKDVNEVKKILAFEVVNLRENEEVANDVLKEAENIFSQNVLPDLETLVLKGNKEDVLLKLMLENNVIKSMKDGKTLITSNAIKINDEPVQEFSFTFKEDGEFKLSVGKKKHYKIIIS